MNFRACFANHLGACHLGESHRTCYLLDFIFILLRVFGLYDFLFGFFLAVRGSSFVVMFEFGVGFDIIFDDFDESFLEERVVVFDPGG